MAKLYTDATGTPLRLDLTLADLQRAAPSGAATTLDFDPDANPQLVINCQLQPAAVRATATATTIGTVPYAVQPASAAYQNDQKVAAALATFLGGTDLTLAQLNAVVRWVVRRALAS